MGPTDRPRRRGRRRIAALATLIAAGGLLLALPYLVSGTVARRILTSRARNALAPGSLDARSVRVSWFGPTAVDGPVLRDPRGNPLVVADRATVDWNLWQILFQPAETVSLKLHGAAVEIERQADGRIDLYETLRPVIRDDPEHRLVIEIASGRLRYRDPALAGPVVAERLDLSIDIPRRDRPVEWNLALEHSAGDGHAPGRVVFKGRVPRPGGGDASVSLQASGWPWALAIAGRTARGELEARVSADRREERWTLSGDATTQLARTATTVNPGAESQPFGPIHAIWDVDHDGRTWTARRLELDMPYARIGGAGTVHDADGIARLDLKGSLTPDWERIEADLRRDVEPNARIAGRPREWQITGPLGETGTGTADRLGALVGEIGVQLDALDIFGMKLSATSLVLRADRGRIRIDPIDARLNDGTLHLEPEVARAGDGPTRITLGASTTLKDAVVNDEVSHRILSYVAPVLDGATRVRGRVSVGGLDAEFPLGATPASTARVEGNIVFDDVQFLPGPLADAIIDLVPNARDAGPDRRPMLTLQDPVSFRIADRKIHQHGLMLPLGQLGSAGLEGSVDFEKRLDLVARFRVNPPRADRPVLAALLNNARFELPIRGTLEDPRIDEDALKERLKSLGSDMLENSIAAGADGLLRLLDGLPRRREARKPPADAPGLEQPPRPEPPPRRSAEERRELREQRRVDRLEKKAQRRMRREGSTEESP